MSGRFPILLLRLRARKMRMWLHRTLLLNAPAPIRFRSSTRNHHRGWRLLRGAQGRQPMTSQEKKREESLDDALDDSFPASDPPSHTNPSQGTKRDSDTLKDYAQKK
jgi:hypothetical protein